MSVDAAVLVQHDGPVALLSFNRPERLNAWGTDLSQPMLDALEELQSNESVRVVVLTGEGRAFCAGANLKSRGGIDTHIDEGSATTTAPSGMPTEPRWRRRDLRETRHPVFDTLSHYPKPLIAAVNGFAIGIGCLIPTCCSFAVASEDAVFSLPQVRLNILPAYGGTLRLARFVGSGHAMNMAITGRRISADEALAMGLVTAIYPRERLREEAIALGKEVARAPGPALQLTQEALDYGYDSGLRAAEQADLLREFALREGTNETH